MAVIEMNDESPIFGVPDNASVEENHSRPSESRISISNNSAFIEMVDELHNLNCLY
jgi:hypothetical protein